MLELKEVELQDRDWVAPLMKKSGLRGSEFTFSNLYNWSRTYNVRIGQHSGFFILKNAASACRFLYPVGEGDFNSIIELFSQQAHEEGAPLVLYGVPVKGKEKLEELYPNRFEFEPVRDSFDYIYLREKLATLSGKKLHGKRNHINRFIENNPDWKYEQISAENLAEAFAMSLEWCKTNGCDDGDDNQSLQREACAVKSGLNNYEYLGLTGGLLRVDGRVVAFTFGSRVTEDTFVVHVEKAFSEIQGAYPMINQQFVINELESYTYVNREDDVGDPGLRKAKESYQPFEMYERYVAKER